MNGEPTKAYVYQPDPDTGKPNPRIYAVGGPGSQAVRSGIRFTKSEALDVAFCLNHGLDPSVVLTGASYQVILENLAYQAHRDATTPLVTLPVESI